LGSGLRGPDTTVFRVDNASSGACAVPAPAGDSAAATMRGLRDLRIELSLLNRRQNPWIRCVVAWPKTSTLDWASHPKSGSPQQISHTSKVFVTPRLHSDR